jgi:hypothetical protein
MRRYEVSERFAMARSQTVRSRYGMMRDEVETKEATPQMDTRPLNIWGGQAQIASLMRAEEVPYSVANSDMGSAKSLTPIEDAFHTPASSNTGSVRGQHSYREEALDSTRCSDRGDVCDRHWPGERPHSEANSNVGSVRGRQLHQGERPNTADNQDIMGSLRSRHTPTTPKRKSSRGATLKRSYTVDERKRKSTTNIPQLDGPSDMPERKKISAGARGMAWLQRPEKKGAKIGMVEALREIPAPMSALNMKGKNTAQDRSFTDPARPTIIESAATRSDVDMMKRAISSGSRFKKAFTMGSDNPTDEESLDNGSNGDKKAKHWKKRVFSKDFFKPDTKAHKLERMMVLPTTVEYSESDTPTPSIKSACSDKTVVTKQSHGSRSSLGTSASQAASTTEEFQFDGMGSIPLDEESTEKVFNDSVIGMIDGKVGGMLRRRGGQQWRSPILTLDVQVIAPIDRIPVKVGQERETWIAVVLRGLVAGEIDTPGVIGNSVGIGLDVGVLLDIS